MQSSFSEFVALNRKKPERPPQDEGPDRRLQIEGYFWIALIAIAALAIAVTLIFG